MLGTAHSDSRLVVTIDGALGAGFLWIVAVGLMSWETFAGDQPGVVGRWALIVSMMAACWTLTCVIDHARRVVLEVISYEFRARDMSEGGVATLRRER